MLISVITCDSQGGDKQHKYCDKVVGKIGGVIILAVLYI